VIIKLVLPRNGGRTGILDPEYPSRSTGALSSRQPELSSYIIKEKHAGDKLPEPGERL
jgi:hypothetical protein